MQIIQHVWMLAALMALGGKDILSHVSHVSRAGSPIQTVPIVIDVLLH